MNAIRIAAALALTAALGGCAADVPPPALAAPADAPAFEPVRLTAPDGREVELMVMAPDAPRGAILFSHGGNSSPEAMRALVERLARQGFAVVAPRHSDSLTLPVERRQNLQAAFPSRVADMKLAADYAGRRFASKPLAAVGYSYGSLFALMGGGALSPTIPGAIPGLKAVVMFSSPGPIRPLTDMPTAFASVTLPTLLVTGTADTVPGFVTDPAQHLMYFDRLPAGDHTALIVTDATHLFAGREEPGATEVAALVSDFLGASVLGDGPAAARFAAAKSTDRVEVRRR